MTPTARPPRSIWDWVRYSIPVLALAVALAPVGYLWLRPGIPLDSKGPNTFFIVIGLTAFLTLWVIALSGLRWYSRVIIVALVAIASIVIGSGIVFDGDMIPHWRSPLENHDDEIESHRERQRVNSIKRLETVPPGSDWAEFRGPKRDGVVSGPKLARDWSTKPPRLIWKQPCGAGYSSFAISGDLLITLEQRRDNEAVVAYEVSEGREIWKHEYPARFWEPLGGLGPRTTPTIVGDDVYSLGAKGDLVRLDAKTGKPLADRINILPEGQNLPWGMAGSPLVAGDLLVVNPGAYGRDGPNRAVLILDRFTLKQVRAIEGKKAGYSSPMSATIAEQKQVIILDGDQVAGYDIDRGVQLWTYEWSETREDINVAQPLVWEAEGRVFISSGYTIGGAMLQLKRDGDNWSVEPVWVKPNKPLRCKMSSPVEYNGFLYGLDEGYLACIDAKDGALKWRGERYGHGQLLRCEDRLILLAENGDLVYFEATPAAERQLGRVNAIKSVRTWNVPAMSNGFIFVRNDREMACFDLRE